MLGIPELTADGRLSNRLDRLTECGASSGIELGKRKDPQQTNQRVPVSKGVRLISLSLIIRRRALTPHWIDVRVQTYPDLQPAVLYISNLDSPTVQALQRSSRG